MMIYADDIRRPVMSSVNPAANIWETVLELLQNEMTPTTIKTWFDDVEAVALEEDEFVIYSPTPWKRDIVVSRYAKYIENALENLFSTKIRNHLNNRIIMCRPVT